MTEIAGIPLHLTRKNIRTLRLTIRPPEGEIFLSAPLFVSDAQIEAFVCAKREWILATQAEIRRLPPPKPSLYAPEEKLALFDQSFFLHITEGGSYHLTLDQESGEALWQVRQGSTPAQREAWLKEWYRDQLRREIALRLPRWESITGLSCRDFQIKDMRTRWGTCNTSTGKLWFSLHLAQKPYHALEYVILHELCHLQVPNHGKDFVRLLDRYMPSWRKIKAELNQRQ